MDYIERKRAIGDLKRRLEDLESSNNYYQRVAAKDYMTGYKKRFSYLICTYSSECYYVIRNNNGFKVEKSDEIPRLHAEINEGGYLSRFGGGDARLAQKKIKCEEMAKKRVGELMGVE